MGHPEIGGVRWRETVDWVGHPALSFSEGLAPAKMDGLWGYIDVSGTFLIRPIFQAAAPFKEGLARVKSEGGWGYCDKSGSSIIEPKFLHAREFHCGLAAVELDNKWGYISKDGRFAINNIYSYCHSFSEGLAAVEYPNEKSMGFIDIGGKTAIEPRFFNAGNFHCELAFVEMDKSICYIDRMGEIVWQGQFYPTDFCMDRLGS